MTIAPESAADLQAAVLSHEQIQLTGAGTKMDGAGRGGAAVLSARRLTGILEYSAAECVVAAGAGTPLAEINQALAQHDQYLPFDPPFSADGATIGGTVAAGVSGPGRYRYGGVRDFVIGARVVDGDGRVIRSGGKVVKNAAGFLLHHALVGSRGRLGAIVELNFKVFPRPEAREWLVVDCGDVPRAFETTREVESVGRDCEAIDFDHRGQLSITVAGRREAVAGRLRQLADRLGRGDRPRDDEGGAWTPLGVEPDESIVKVAGAVHHWPALQAHVRAARFMCAGAVAWLWTGDLTGLASALETAHLTGHVFRGRDAGRLIGQLPHNEFEERVRRVLDPRSRFSAARHPHR